jgi:anti-sigma B factor antagonist
MSESSREMTFELLRLQCRREGGTHVVSAGGELDLASSKALARELGLARASDANHILLDLSDLTFIDCAGLRVILCMDAQSGDRPGRFLVQGGSPHVQRVFALTSAAKQLRFVG